MNIGALPGGLARLEFDNRFTCELPADPETDNTRRQIREACYSRVLPTTVAAPALVGYARAVAEALGLSEKDCTSEAFAAIFTGNRLLPGMDPHATCYGGHQFGTWAGQLGDGRAIVLGEVVNAAGERHVLQLKGAGLTPYSRSADGLAVLRSSVREFLCSEAMHHLGVPTTRALSLTLTGEQVMRDVLYDGNAALEPGAVVCRVAPSFTRFGHFQMLAARQEHALLKTFLDYTIDTDFPHLSREVPEKDRYLAWFAEVSRRTVEMVVHWMRVGFVHGVMNTDNMSVLGLTIDYGPYGWLEDYDPNWTPNTTDAAGRRYRFSHQPAVAQWNLLQLANAILPLIDASASLEQILSGFQEQYVSLWQTMMAAKLGLQRFEPDTDADLFTELDVVLQLTETDMTLFYRRLASIDVDGSGADALEALLDAYYQPEELQGEVRDQIEAWLTSYLGRARADARERDEQRNAMNAVNPKYVLRNYLAQLVIDKAEQGDYSMVYEVLELLRRPYDEQPEHEQFAVKRPDWARSRVGCSQLSCSS